MNTKKLHDWWTAEAKWLSIMMGERVERRTVVKLCCLWVQLALLFVPSLREGTINGWWVTALIAMGMLAYSAAVDLTETERHDKED